MQWLIDIIKARIHSQLGYFNRGDNTPNDFTTGDFTLDGAWHDLDLSGIVPEDSKCVNLKVNVRASIVDNRFDIRQNGNVNTANLLSVWTQVKDRRIGGVFPVNVDSARIVEYRGTAGNWTLVFINVNGWWLR